MTNREIEQEKERERDAEWEATRAERESTRPAFRIWSPDRYQGNWPSLEELGLGRGEDMTGEYLLNERLVSAGIPRLENMRALRDADWPTVIPFEWAHELEAQLPHLNPHFVDRFTGPVLLIGFGSQWSRPTPSVLRLPDYLYKDNITIVDIRINANGEVTNPDCLGQILAWTEAQEEMKDQKQKADVPMTKFSGKRGATRELDGEETGQRPPKMPRPDEIAAALIAHRGNVAAAAQSLLKRMRM
jgi:hypothetical protein